MIKRIALMVGFVLLVSTAAMADVVPHGDVTLTKDKITLGDVFDGVLANTEFELAPAPNAGETLVWNAATLQKISDHFGLGWQAKSNDTVRFTRGGNIVSRDEVLKLVTAALRDQGIDGRFTVTLAAFPDAGWSVVDANAVKVENLSIDREKGTLHLTLRAGKDSLVSDGSIIAMVAVPTLNRTIATGETIGASDLTYVDMKVSDVRKDAVLQSEKLVGLTPRKTMAVGSLVRDSDVVAPRLIKRGDTVTLMFANSKMRLTTTAKALEDGVLGGRIRVANASSNRTVEGIVDRSGNVVVTN